MEKIRISIVSYLNSKPFVQGILEHPIAKKLDISLDNPAQCAQKLITNQVDIGLIPVAVISDMEYHEILTDYCIGGNGKVKTVVLLSDVPYNQIENIYLDYQSRTSVVLCQVLAQYFWKITPSFVAATEGYESTAVQGKNAAVVIGDRVFDLETKYKYVYDLSEEWQKFTKEEFVFATWTANKALPISFKEEFNQAIKMSIDNIEETIKSESTKNPHIDVRSYYTKHISFELTDSKRQSLNNFLEYKKELIEKEKSRTL